MPNKIKFSPTGTETDSIFASNVAIGVSAPNIGGGPSSTTEFYTAPSVPTSGYVAYNNGVAFTASNDTDLMDYVNSLGAGVATIEAALSWAASNNITVANRDYENIVTDGLILNLDASFTPSYPKSGTTWFDLAGSNDGTLTNGVTYDSANGGVFIFDGTDDFVSTSSTASKYKPANVTLNIWFSLEGVTNANGNWGLFGRITNLFNQGVGMWGFNNTFNFTVNQYNLNFATTPISYGVIYNMQATYDGSNLKLYKNGILASTVAFSDPIIYNDSFLWDVGFGTDIQFSFDGKVYAASAYDRALSAAEILQNYNATKSRFGL